MIAIQACKTSITILTTMLRWTTVPLSRGIGNSRATMKDAIVIVNSWMTGTLTMSVMNTAA
jgi:homoserine kinase